MPKGVYIRTKNRKGFKMNFKDPKQRGINISNAKKGMPNGLLGKKRPKFSDEWIKKLSDAKIGTKRPEEVIRKCVESRRWYKPSKETKEKMRIINTGRKMTEEQKRKLSESKIGCVPWNKGKKASEETKKKLSISHSGERSIFWKGGISFEPYPVGWNKELKEIIRNRDDYTCKMCGIKQIDLSGRCKKLHVHHIDYDKNNLNPKNLIALCINCHAKTSTVKDRNQYIEYFNKIIIQNYE